MSQNKMWKYLKRVLTTDWHYIKNSFQQRIDFEISELEVKEMPTNSQVLGVIPTAPCGQHNCTNVTAPV